MKNGICLTPIHCPKIETTPTERELNAPSGRKLAPLKTEQLKRKPAAKRQTPTRPWQLVMGIGD